MRAISISTLILSISLSAPAWAKTLALSEFLQRAESQSPDLSIEKSMNEEAKARAQGVRIPPPMVGLMTMKENGTSNQGIEISQEIPFPTKILKEKEARANEAKVQNSLFTYRKNAFLLEARTAYFEFWQTFERTKLLNEKKEWLKKHLKVSRSTARSDSAAQIHLLGTESEADLLENEILEMKVELVEKTNALKVFVPDLILTDLEPQEPKLESIELTDKTKSPILDWKESELKAAETSRSLKKQAYLPDLFLRYRSYNGNEMTPKNDEIMVGISLPFLFFWQPQAEVSEASARSQRVEAELRKARVDVETKLNSLLAKSDALEKQILNLKEKLIPRAHRRMRLVDNLSVRSMEGLDQHRMVMLDYLDLQLKEVNARVEFERAMNELSKLLGREARL